MGAGSIILLTPCRRGLRRHRFEEGVASERPERKEPVLPGASSQQREALKKRQAWFREEACAGKDHRRAKRSAGVGAERGEEWGARGRDVCCGELGGDAVDERGGGASGHGTDLRQGVPRIGPAIS